jgi:cystathionine beta-lyase/cystathionine gamma-synthase
VELKDGSQESTCRVLNRLHYFGIGVSWGGFESLAVPVSFPSEASVAPGWGMRLHIGLETVDDLLEDLDQALRG